jgi:hypothetical protein
LAEAPFDKSKIILIETGSEVHCLGVRVVGPELAKEIVCV